MSVLIETTQGNLVLDLKWKTQSLQSVNFLRLCQLNQYYLAPFYDLVKDVSVTSGNSEYPDRSPNYSANEFIDMSVYDKRVGKEPYVPFDNSDLSGIGLVSFVKVDNSIGSEFTISLTESTDSTAFGKVVEGFSLLHNLNIGLVSDIRIVATHILYDPFPKLLEVNLKKKPFVPTPSQLERIKPEENNTSESTLQALALELIGDLPDYNIKPSPKVLFVARLNKLTTQDSLKIIFSRFGQVDQCNIIVEEKKKTNYGFIEFDTKDSAEKAYSTLNKQPCFIDGNEVYIDFSQSVKRGTRT